MTTLIDRPTDRRTALAASPSPTNPEVAPAERLRATTAACRVQFTWFGVQKALTREQTAVAAGAFDAEGPFLSAGKKLLDTRHPAFRAVTAVRTKATEYWRSLTLPFPEPGVRLIRQGDVEGFAAAMAGYRDDLAGAVRGLEAHYADLRRAARERLGSLYDGSDYPATLEGLFDVAWDFPSVEPPAYLLALSPRVYEEERARVAGRFEEAVRLAEQAFLEEFARLVGHLTERLTGANADGTPKVFRESAVGNLSEFFGRFRALNVRSSPELDALVDEARRLVSGVAAQDLRDSARLRARVSADLTRVQASLDTLIADRPRRRVLRGATTGGRS